MGIIVLVVVVVALAVAAYAALRLAGPWLLARFDRALHNGRDRLQPADERPVYVPADLTARWPGWDGWYVLMIPRQPDVPVRAIRVSIMTGLYGLDGIDDYAALQGLSPFEVVEYLIMVQTDTSSHLFRRYLPKLTALAIRREQLLVVVNDWGEISGTWPQYQVRMHDPTTDLELSLTYAGKNLIWWADLPKLFTYVAAFGELQGTLALNGEEYAITGLGSFEHGFARKPVNFDALFKPLRLLQKFFPITLMQYHYNLLIGPDGSYGGMMVARGIGIDFRNLGGMYLPDGSFKRLRDVMIEYVEMEALPTRSAASSFPKQWIVTAKADDAVLEYTARRESPAARLANNMIYFDFYYTGRYHKPGEGAQVLSGHGYGEYVSV